MNLLEDSAIFDHIAHGIFDLVIPALVGWALMWLRKQWGGQVIERLIKRAAGLSYAEMMQRGAGVAGIEGAIGNATKFVRQHGGGAVAERRDLPDMIRGELGALLATRETKPP